jgi:hypothetical protein
MQRRSFLLAAGAGGLTTLATSMAYLRWQEITPRVHAPGREIGHYLRDRRPLPAPTARIETDVVILGSGIAGLTAAWKLQKEKHAKFLVIDGPEPYGNAAGGSYGDLSYPTGAHYLPLPTRESFHVREMLRDLEILQGEPQAQRPSYDERFLLHGPEDRVLFKGKWQEGLLPHEGVPQQELAEHARFQKMVEKLRGTRGKDGKRLFAMPIVQSSQDAEWRALDQQTFSAWLTANGYSSPTLRWYIDYCCRDDYGSSTDQVSAWAGLHYFCSRGGEASNAADGAWLTWPGGLSPVAAGLDHAAGRRRKSGTVVSVTHDKHGVTVLCLELNKGQASTYVVHARKAICAMPLFVAARVIPGIKEFGFDPARDMPHYAPWMVTNFLMHTMPPEKSEAPLSWDNVVYGGKGLGYVVSTHQDIRVSPPAKTVFSAYLALADRTPQAARAWMERATPDELLELAAADLKTAYGRKFALCVERADITLRAHAMATPRSGFLSNRGLLALRAHDGPVLFAHADLSGYSVFEEAAWWGYQAALRALA